MTFGGHGYARIGGETRCHMVESVVGPVWLVVGEQDAPGAGASGQADGVVRGGMAERRQRGHLIRVQERVVDEEIHSGGQAERGGVVLAPPFGAGTERGGTMIGDVGERGVPVADPVPEGAAALMRDFARLHGEAL